MKSQLIKNSKPGFTLIELLIYIALTVLVVGSFIIFTLSISGSRNKTYVAQEVQSNGRSALSLLSQKIRASESVVNPAPGGSGNTLELDMPDAADNLVFSVSGGILYVTEGADAPQAVTSDKVSVTNLKFTNLAASGERDNIKIEITIEYANQSSKEFEYAQSLETSVGRRK